MALGWASTPRSQQRAHALLDALGGVRGLLAAEPEALVASGATVRQARRLTAALALVVRREEAIGVPIVSPADVERVVADELRLVLEERLVVLCLDRRHRVISQVTATVGSASFTIVDPAQVYAIALRHRAAAIVLVHNHPSGDPTPSVQDREVTQRVAAAGRVLGVPLLDHIVVGAAGVCSMREAGDVPLYPSAQVSWAAC